jgi:hypothetical protein
MTDATTEKPLSKSEFNNVHLQEIGHSAGMGLAISNFAEAEKFANLMSISNFVPKHLRGKPADCLAILLQAKRWGDMDPFAVAQKTYFVNDGMAYEAQLVNAIICSRAPIKGRPDLEWKGDGENLECTVSATFVGEDRPKLFTAKMKTITTKSSPLWKQQPAQQIAYFALRAWARLYCPDILLGVYTREERQDMIDITPGDGPTAASTIENELRDEAARERGTKPNVTEVVDQTTGEVTDHPALQDMLAEISASLNEDVLNYKAKAAMDAYGTDPNSAAAIALAKKERKAKLANPPATPAASQANPAQPASSGDGSARGLFGETVPGKKPEADQPATAPA